MKRGREKERKREKEIEKKKKIVKPEMRERKIDRNEQTELGRLEFGVLQ